jgi:uncharacterized protein with HEPN domain
MKDDTTRLRDMLEYARTAQAFVAGRNRRDLDSDRMLYLALLRALEIVGEAASQVSPAGRSTFSSLPWRQIIGMRNRLIHAYTDVNPDVVWATVADSLPPLIAELERILPEDAGSGNV